VPISSIYLEHKKERKRERKMEKLKVMQEIIGLRYELDNYRNDRNWYKVAQIRLEIARLEALLAQTY
jgi:hypothetical protein